MIPMKSKVIIAVFTVSLMLFGIPTTAQRKAHQRFTLILDFNTCATDPNNSNNIICQEKDGTGKPIGQITVTYQGPIADDGTCATNPSCNGTWHEGYHYTFNGGTISVPTATAYQGQAPYKDENGFAPIIGFSAGAITGGTGQFQGVSGTLSMRWDANVCICLFDISEP
jgi:hypothetical protein